MEHYYGEPPVDLGAVAIRDWDEFMHYLYLPVRIPARDNARGGLGIDCDAHDPATGFQFAIPERLGFLAESFYKAWRDAKTQGERFEDPYIYLTARRGFATPGNPLNRPGWHCDDFGGTDLNYIWTDAYPTRFLLSSAPLDVPADDADSMVCMTELAEVAQGPHDATNGVATLAVEDAPLGHLLRLSPYVIHDTPIIPAPGGMRSFFKISISTHRYNLLGNSHNHLLDYEWQMYDRAEVRNQPGGNGDYVKEGLW